jgi:alpha-1,6-mannosyltransferase
VRPSGQASEGADRTKALIALTLLSFPAAPSSDGTGDDRLAGLGLLAATAAILRAELAALVLPFAGMLWLQGVPPRRLVKTGLTWVLPSLGALVATTVARTRASRAAVAINVDSYFWQRKLVWAELQGVLFNVLHGKSADWGVRNFASVTAIGAGSACRPRPFTPTS